MSNHESNKTPQVTTPTSPKHAETTVDEAEFDEIMVDNSTDVDDHGSRGGKKAIPSFRLTEVESLLFFNIIRFNRCPDQVDWEKVAEHSSLKNKSVRVRFRQIIVKHGLSDLMSTPRRKPAVVGGRRRGRKAKNMADGVVAANQHDGDGQSITGPAQGDPETRDFQLAVPETQIAMPQTQSETPGSQRALPFFQVAFRAPQTSHGAEPEPARSSPVVNNSGFSPLFALPAPQQQQKQQLSATTQGGPAGYGPSDPFFDPNVPLGVASIDANVNGGTNLSMIATAEQPQEIQEQVINEQTQSFHNLVSSDDPQQIGNHNNVDNTGATADMGVSPNDQPPQTNNQSGTNTNGTQRYIKFRFVDDPSPYLADPKLQVNYSEGHRKWRVETTMHIDQDIGSDYDI